MLCQRDRLVYKDFSIEVSYNALRSLQNDKSNDPPAQTREPQIVRKGNNGNDSIYIAFQQEIS